MSMGSMVKRTLKYLLYFMLAMVLILLLFISYVLNTESGSRFAIKQGISFAELNLTYDSINGTLSEGLIINNIRYQDQAIDIVIKYIKYQSEWTWFSRHLELNKINLVDVIVTSKITSETDTKSQPFTGIELPLTIDIKQLMVNQLTIVSNSVSGTSSNSIDHVELSALIETKTAVINRLLINATDYGATVSGSLDYSEGLSYELEADWQAQSEAQSVQASGPIEGNLNAIQLQQVLNLESEQLTGQFTLQGDIKELQNRAEFDLQVTANTAQFKIDQQTIELSDLQVVFKGLIDDYKLSLQSVLRQNQLNQINLPTSQINLQASGNSQHLTTQVAQIITPEGMIELQADIGWQDKLQITSQLELSNFNPQQLLNDWPGLINGQIKLNLQMTEHGVVITTRNNTLKGQLKGQPFALTGSANYATDTLTADQLKLILGDNSVLINGQINQQKVALSTAVNWIDLSLIDPQLAGQIEGTVELSGDYLNPHVKAELFGKQLTYTDYQVATLTINSEGQWNKTLTSDISAENTTVGGQAFNTIQIKQHGWLDSHEIDISLVTDELSTDLQIKGKYDNNATKKQAVWSGQLLSHELIVDNDKKIQLQAPIAIEIADHISIEAGCWKGVEAGTLCLALNDINQTDSHYQGSLTLDAFSLIPLQVLLPGNIEVKGKLQGVAEFLFHADDLNIKSNLKLEGGEIWVRNEQEIAYQSVIEVFEIDAKTTNQNIDITINTKLADNSYLNLQTRLENPDGQEWQINSSVEGIFFSTELIKQLSEEIKELEGQVSIDGSINGPLSKPSINLNLSQADGYLTLTRLGTVINNLKLTINTEGITQPVYNIKFSGNNLVTINQGQIESSGQLSFPADKQWQYQGDITGDNFMLLNLPEARFNISPDLAIMATDQSTDISGDLVIDSGNVIVKQLPPSSVSNSDDLEIHNSETENTTVYPFTMNIRAGIKDPIKLDVIGLDAGLTGSIHLVKIQGKTLEGNGILNLTDGSYEIYGQKLNINEGELTFTGPLDNPRLNVKASRKSISGDVVVGVELGGTVNNLQSNLYSEPSLSDIEKLSYIMTGRGIENSGSLDGESLKQAAIVMGLNQSSPIFNQIQSQFGIDVLTVKESAVAADTVVEAGKKINDKLYVSYNQGLFNRMGFWMLKYRLNEFLNLQTTQGEDQSIELVYTRKAAIKKNSDK